MLNDNVYVKNKLLYLKFCAEMCLFQIKIAKIKISYNLIFTKLLFSSPCPHPSHFVLWFHKYVYVLCKLS